MVKENIDTLFSKFYIEFGSFKQEFTALKIDMSKFYKEFTSFKKEMYVFKDDMYAFKDEMGKFKQETRSEFKKVNKKQLEHTHSLLTIEDTIGYYADMYKINKDDIKQLNSRVTVLENR